jgi:hypothetical protein
MTIELERFMQLANPTGGKHTPTPWRKATEGDAIEKSVTFYQTMLKSLDEKKWSERAIADGDGKVLAFFLRPEDRDLALYFTNIHAAVIGYLRALANSFDFIKASTADEACQAFAENQATLCRAYADLFARLGKPEETTCPND